jgi:hypothetical protein
MRKFVLLLLVVASVFVTPAIAAHTAALKPVPRKAADIFIPLGNTGRLISLQQLATIQPARLATLTGKKMSVADRVGFWLAQRKLRHSINADGTVNSEKLATMYRAEGGGFHLGGFALGFFLGLIGVLIAYLIKDDKKRSRTKWAWIGWLIGFVLVLLLII